MGGCTHVERRPRACYSTRGVLMDETSVTVRITDVDAGGIRLAVSSAGEPGAPLVVLLHGFPEIGYAWRHQIRSLAAAGFRVAAPDQRGHGWSEVPDAVEDYRLDRLVSDVVGLIDADGADEAVVVGHGWGAHVATAAAFSAPDRVRAIAMLSTPFETPGADSGDDPLRAASALHRERSAEYQADPFAALRRIQWTLCGGRPAGWSPDDALPSGVQTSCPCSTSPAFRRPARATVWDSMLATPTWWR